MVLSIITWQGCLVTSCLTAVWKSDWTVESCMSEHTLKTKWTHFKSHKIKVIDIVYWESVKLIIFSSKWIFHDRWWSMDTLPNILYPIFHVWLNTSERRSVNRNSNLIKVVILAQYWENRLTVMFLNTLRQYHYFNEVCIVVNTSYFTCTVSNMKHRIEYVRQGVHGLSTSVEYFFKAENNQFDTISVHNINYLNLVTFEMCSFCI